MNLNKTETDNILAEYMGSLEHDYMKIDWYWADRREYLVIRFSVLVTFEDDVEELMVNRRLMMEDVYRLSDVQLAVNIIDFWYSEAIGKLIDKTMEKGIYVICRPGLETINKFNKT